MCLSQVSCKTAVWIMRIFNHLGAEYLVLNVQDSAEDEDSESTATENSALEDPDNSKVKLYTKDVPDERPLLLQSGVAWAIGLSLRDTAAEILFKASCGLTSSPESEYPNLLYRFAPNCLHARKFGKSNICLYLN